MNNNDNEPINESVALILGIPLIAYIIVTDIFKKKGINSISELKDIIEKNKKDKLLVKYKDLKKEDFDFDFSEKHIKEIKNNIKKANTQLKKSYDNNIKNIDNNYKKYIKYQHQSINNNIDDDYIYIDRTKSNPTCQLLINGDYIICDARDFRGSKLYNDDLFEKLNDIFQKIQSDANKNIPNNIKIEWLGSGNDYLIGVKYDNIIKLNEFSDIFDFDLK